MNDKCSLCGHQELKIHAVFDTPPATEIDYGFSPYHRELRECLVCGHFTNQYGSGIQLEKLYEGSYWDKTYEDKILTTFNKIMSLPKSSSDNQGRVNYICSFMREWDPNASLLLDIGSGLAVFPAVMKENGWDVTALDPDPKASEHARVNAGVDAMTADYLSENVEGFFDLITLNKVLEHVPDMVGMLAKTKSNLTPNGIVYVELPDGEAAIGSKEGCVREEFFVEHLCAFSIASYVLLAKSAGFEVLTCEKLVEPSGKYTIRGFLRPR